ncbi:MAG: hypothetical protein ABFC96_10605 [Thermoguttaceae bacterium]
MNQVLRSKDLLHSYLSRYLETAETADRRSGAIDFALPAVEEADDDLAAPGTDRIRAIFGLRPGIALPRVSAETALTFYRHLIRHLTLPCEARYCSDAAGAVYPVTVRGLLDPRAAPFDQRTGLCCIAYHKEQLEVVPLVDIEVGEQTPNYQLLEDYWFWMWNWHDARSCRPCKPR